MPKKLSKLLESNSFLTNLVLLALLGGLIRLVFAVYLPLDGDEAYQILISNVAVIPMLKATLSAYPPLWSFILHFFEQIFQNYIVVRFLSGIVGTISIIIIGLIGRALFNPKVGILTALVFALSPTQIYYSSYLRVYAFAILVSLLTFILFINFLKHSSSAFKDNLLLFSIMTLGNYTYYLYPVLTLSLLTYLLYKIRTLGSKFKTFTILFILALLITLPLYLSFLRVEPVPSAALPQFSLQKIFLIPVHYTFPLNLAIAINPEILSINNLKIMLLGFSLVNIGLLAFTFTGRLKKNEQFLTIMLIIPILITIIFSIMVFSVFGLRSILIFSIPFYLFIGISIAKNGFLKNVYVIVSIITILSTLIFFAKKPSSAVDSFVFNNVNLKQPILHTEMTTFYYYSYKMPQLDHRAAIDSLYMNQINKTVLGFIPTELSKLKDKEFWLIEVIPSPLHKNQAVQFKSCVGKTHNQTLLQKFSDVNIIKYEPKTR
ncbi:MAG: hypothetical protein UT12_C0016G0003 [Candidatus Curtissbacteria bacterium GW2011_GWC2_38_9]|uniref:Glycosyltransferase RgtA/B/C/D-like domain-containing protein n=3 Tax=Candidatus Curtissiibacteriota TaxID=1752717 RepID=A0A1F5HTV8_9BACT|nr:MAG: hypothetical protein UT12_C0016G0003 [Candidatus Curtissbacteria bacterium GW2011_GWC2_38_9]KKS04344.1 MAG: hypothetical protein UU56_C0007G0031 [Candidatus Curtissbacteria bacterium GW2011_GWA2_41_24]OGE07612.1 MAG: hypothetical protein A2W70_02365 [Candidatus Curtissbacteria bacterium RIFCSPLOWO2_02_41_11]